MWTTIGYAIRFHKRESLFLVFGLMGALFGLFLSLTTVYLGEQMTQVLFLLLGWSQSLRDTGSEVEVVVPKYAFQRVIAS
jgi:predicted membrane channel-forming protein YqfA (hemolysin III family)